ASPSPRFGQAALQPAAPLDGRLLSGGRTVGRVRPHLVLSRGGTGWNPGVQDCQRLSVGPHVSRPVHQPQNGLAHRPLPVRSPAGDPHDDRVLFHRTILGLAVSWRGSSNEAPAANVEADFTALTPCNSFKT